MTPLAMTTTLALKQIPAKEDGALVITQSSALLLINATMLGSVIMQLDFVPTHQSQRELSAMIAALAHRWTVA
jgi:deoxyinosine 3'endonuclease (endonuclease V)